MLMDALIGLRWRCEFDDIRLRVIRSDGLVVRLACEVRRPADGAQVRRVTLLVQLAHQKPGMWVLDALFAIGRMPGHHLLINTVIAGLLLLALLPLLTQLRVRELIYIVVALIAGRWMKARRSERDAGARVGGGRQDVSGKDHVTVVGNIGLTLEGRHWSAGRFETVSCLRWSCVLPGLRCRLHLGRSC